MLLDIIFWHVITGIVLMPIQAILVSKDFNHFKKILTRPKNWLGFAASGYLIIFGIGLSLMELYRDKVMYCEKCEYKMSEHMFKVMGCPCCHTRVHIVKYNKIKHELGMSYEEYCLCLTLLEMPIEKQHKEFFVLLDEDEIQNIKDWYLKLKDIILSESKVRHIRPIEISVLAYVSQHDTYIGTRTEARILHHKVEKKIRKVAVETSHYNYDRSTS